MGVIKAFALYGVCRDKSKRGVVGVGGIYSREGVSMYNLQRQTRLDFTRVTNKDLVIHTNHLMYHEYAVLRSLLALHEKG